MTDTRVTATEAGRSAEAMADAVATALAKYAVAYSHSTLRDLSTVDRMWRVHETGFGNPFERDVWLGTFDNKVEADALCAELRRSAAIDAARHRLAHQPASADQEEVIEWLFEVRCFLKSITNSDNEERWHAGIALEHLDSATAALASSQREADHLAGVEAENLRLREAWEAGRDAALAAVASDARLCSHLVHPLFVPVIEGLAHTLDAPALASTGDAIGGGE